MEHLNESAQKALLLNKEEKIQRILSDKWIGYTRAKNIMDKMEDLLQHPKVIRMPNMLVVGNTNNGKTQLLHRFFNQHKPIIKPEDANLRADVIYMQAPPKPDENKFYNSLLERIYAPFKLTERTERKQQQAIRILRTMETKMLIIDEIHHVLAGNLGKQRGFLNIIKYLSNELQIVIVAAGIKDAFNAIQTDAQLSNRFEPAILPKWIMNEEYLRLLASFEYSLPLKNASNLIETDLALKILSMSEGTIGEISSILKKSAIAAIKSGREVIDKKIIDSIDYITPTDRKKMREKLT